MFINTKRGAFVNKSELINAIAENADLSKAAAGRALDATVTEISDSFAYNEPVTLIGFGTFEVRE